MSAINAYMNIQVRVLSAGAAAQIRAMQAQINGLNSSMAAAGATAVGAGMIGGQRQLSALSKFGNQLQWTGRQLQYNFSLPLAIAGVAATNFAMENERAFTRIAKVYGDTTLAADVMKNELEALRKAFVALSNHYGVHQKAVLDIAADWAAAGASGVALARGVEQTLRVMVLGEMEAVQATEALIAIQAQYNLSSSQLVDTIAKLNVVENQTAISMQGLVQGFQRAAGVARSAGVDVDHLAAMLAALVPAAGTAAQAGNALKTILSRLMSPTTRAKDVMKEMGINLESVAWQSANGSQRLEILAKKFHGLADSQRAVVSETIASRYQINKFEILMEQIYKGLDKSTESQSRYAQALKATEDRSKYLAQAEKELRAVLESNPQKMQQIWVILQNAMADIIIPMIPVILMAANGLRVLAESFRDLPPEVQKAITFGLLFLALFGPMLRYIGSTMTLIGELMWFFGGLAGAAFGAAKGLASIMLFPFTAVATGLGAMAGGMMRFGAAAMVGARAVGAFLLTRPMVIAVLTAIRAAFMGTGAAMVMIWTQALVRIRMVTGPMLLGVQAAFMLWTAGLTRIMVLARTAVTAGWAAMVVASRWVGPVLLAMTTTLWAALVTATKMGAAAMVIRVRAMWVAIAALFANWRLILVRSVTVMWAAIVAASRAGAILLVRGMVVAIGALIGPWGIAIMALLAVVYMFRDEIGQVVQNTVSFFQNMPPGIAAAFKPIVGVFHGAVAAVQKGFNALPQGVRDAMLAVVNIVASAARQVYELFSYLNPFAHHSPSLVENVTNGMDVVKRQFASITDIAGPIRAAYREIKAFGIATASLMNGMDSARRSEDRVNIGKVAPGALDEFDALVRRIMQLTGMLARLKSAVDAQQSVVDSWRSKLDAANAALDRQNDKLSELQKNLDAAKDRLSGAQDALQRYANTPIKGMKAFEDQIFANEMAQKRLRLEMLRMEQAGKSMEDLQAKAQALAGQIEFLSGEQQSLRDAGAGSEILSVYDSQIDALEKQQSVIGKQQTEYQKLSSELEKLQRQAEIMDLEKSLKFDALQRQIENAANSTKELTFEQIMEGIKRSNSEIAKYTVEVYKANKAVEDQKRVVDAATAARDAINKRYDLETAKLDKLKDAYDKVNATIQDINTSLQDMASAASSAIQKAEEARRAAEKAKGSGALGAEGNFPDVSGAGGLGREGGLGDQSALIDQFTQDMAKKTGDLLGGFDLFGPVKKKFSELKGWFSKNVGPVFGAIGDAVGEIFGGIDWMEPVKNIDWTFLQTIWDTAKDIFWTAVEWIKNIVSLFADDFKEVWDAIWNALKSAWQTVGPELAKFKELLGPIGDLFQQIWSVVKVVAGVLGVVLLGALKIVSSVFAEVLGPVLDLVIGLFKNIIKVIRGLLEFIVGVFTGNWELAWQGIKDIVSGVFGAIWEIIKGAVGIVWGIIKGFVEGIVDFFKWLYDVLVGHSIIPDMVKAIIKWIGSLPGKAWDALKTFGSKILDQVKKAWDSFTAANTAAWNTINNWFKGRPQAVWNALSELAAKLRDRAKAALDNFLLGAKTAWNFVSNWFTGRKDAIASNISNIPGNLRNAASNAINKFKDGAESAWTNVRNFFSGIGNKIKNAVGNINLFNIGKAIFQSLWDGLQAIWGDMKNWLGGIGNQIKNVKGPIEKDRKLLIPEGRAIMQSLGVGLEAAWPGVQSWLKTVAPGIHDAIFTGVVSAMPTGLKSPVVPPVGGAIANANARIGAGQGSSGTVPTGESNGTHIENHFHGELVFPNVTNGADAEEFILNLEALIRG